MGQRLVFVPECQSTNSLMVELTSKTTLPEGTVVITSNQYAGRGQRGNTWQTAAGMNLTFSVLLRPAFLSIKNQFALTIVTSLAVVDYLVSKNPGDVKIKWPNDILVSKKKICGILIENSIQGDSINQSIVGVGLNVNQLEFSVATATSLGLLCKTTFDLNEQWNSLLEKLERRYLQLRAGKQKELKEEYLKNLLGIHHLQKFISNGTGFEGTIKTISDQGELIVDVSGVEKVFSLKEISFVF